MILYILCRFILEHVSSLNNRASKCSERVGKLVFGSVILHLTVRFLLFDYNSYNNSGCFDSSIRNGED